MPYRDVPADELLEKIYELVERLVDDGPAETRHERANIGNEIVLCASVLRQRVEDVTGKRSEDGLQHQPSGQN